MHWPICGYLSPSKHRKSFKSSNFDAVCCTYISGGERRIACAKVGKIWLVELGLASGLNSVGNPCPRAVFMGVKNDTRARLVETGLIFDTRVHGP